MVITSSMFFGAAFILIGTYTIIKKSAIISFGESKNFEKFHFQGATAILIGVVLVTIGTLILHSDGFSNWTIIEL